MTNRMHVPSQVNSYQYLTFNLNLEVGKLLKYIYIYGIRSLMAIVFQFGGGLLRIYLSKSVII